MLKQLILLFAEKFLQSKKSEIQHYNGADFSRSGIATYTGNFIATADGFVLGRVQSKNQDGTSCSDSSAGKFEIGGVTCWELYSINGWSSTSTFRVSKGQEVKFISGTDKSALVFFKFIPLL